MNINNKKISIIKPAVAILLAVILFVHQLSPVAFGLTNEQKQVIDSGALYFNINQNCGPGSQPAPSPKPTSVYILGDSITASAKATYESKLQGQGIAATINGLSSRKLSGAPPSPDGLTAINQDSAAITASEAIVVGLGTNGAFTGENINAAIARIKALNSKAPIYWVDTAVVTSPRIQTPGELAVVKTANQLIYERAGTLGFKVIPWFQAVFGQNKDPRNPGNDLVDTNQLIGDAYVHPNQKGNDVLVDLVITSLTTSTSGSTSAGGCQCSLSGTGGPVNLTVSTTFSLGVDEKERRVNLVKALMADFGLTAEQASGPVGNFMLESGGKHLPPNVNEGGSAGPPRFSGGYGWAQWTASRQRTFIQFAVENGFMASTSSEGTDAANYAYLKKELSEGYTSTIEELKKQTTPEDAAVSFEATFEKAGVPALEGRKANARQVFTEYGGGGPSSAGGSCGDASGAAIVGDTAFPLITKKGGIRNPSIFTGNSTNTAGHPYTAYDILVSPGTPVAAFIGGKVVKIGEDKCPGRLISIFNEESNITVSYLHLDFNNHVSLGDSVLVGQRIGLVGSAGNGCGVPHLHIDAVNGDSRPGCRRESCSDDAKEKFVDIGPQLFTTFQKLSN